MHEQMINAGEVPDPGPPDGATPEGSSEGDEHNGEESDEEGKVLHCAHRDALKLNLDGDAACSDPVTVTRRGHRHPGQL